jgi:hypothetical protein
VGTAFSADLKNSEKKHEKRIERDFFEIFYIFEKFRRFAQKHQKSKIIIKWCDKQKKRWRVNCTLSEQGRRKKLLEKSKIRFFKKSFFFEKCSNIRH